MEAREPVPKQNNAHANTQELAQGDHKGQGQGTEGRNNRENGAGARESEKTEINWNINRQNSIKTAKSARKMGKNEQNISKGVKKKQYTRQKTSKNAPNADVLRGIREHEQHHRAWASHDPLCKPRPTNDRIAINRSQKAREKEPRSLAFRPFF
jgi:hypothetical protein